VSDADGKCDDCGRFISYGAAGLSWADQYTFYPPGCDYVHQRCPRCTERLGPVTSNARPHDGNMGSFQGINTPDREG